MFIENDFWNICLTNLKKKYPARQARLQTRISLFSSDWTICRLNDSL